MSIIRKGLIWKARRREALQENCFYEEGFYEDEAYEEGFS